LNIAAAVIVHHLGAIEACYDDIMALFRHIAWHLWVPSWRNNDVVTTIYDIIVVL
jgi:hypothetical protein